MSSRRAVRAGQRRDDLVGVDGLGEIVERAELDRDDGGGDRAIAGQDDRARVGPPFLQGPHHVEAAAVAELEIDDGEAGRASPEGRQASATLVGDTGCEAARRHGAAEPFGERLVVIDDQQRVGQPVRARRARAPSVCVASSFRHGQAPLTRIAQAALVALVVVRCGFEHADRGQRMRATAPRAGSGRWKFPACAPDRSSKRLGDEQAEPQAARPLALAAPRRGAVGNVGLAEMLRAPGEGNPDRRRR